MLVSARTLETPGLNRDWRGVPRSISSWEAQNSGLDPEKRVPQLLNSPGPHFSKACILSPGCALPLPESPQGERGKKRKRKEALTTEEGKGNTRGGRRGATQEWVKQETERADLGQI